MNLVKKILVVHGDARERRRVVLTLADAGYDIRAFALPDQALATARLEWFDLALIDNALPSLPGYEFTEALKRVQPTVPVILLVEELELSLIVQGIRLGLADVLAGSDDPRPLLRSVNGLLRKEMGGQGGGLTAAELAEVETALARYTLADDDASGGGGDGVVDQPDLRDELSQGARERAGLEAKLERVMHERAALEAELKTLLAQNADAVRLKAELADLHTQREMAAAAQAAIDAKARQLAQTRAAIAVERDAIETERRQLRESASAFALAEPDSELEQAKLAAMREDLRDEEERLRNEAARLRQEATQLAQERRRWHEDLDVLRTQEENLRAYEERLRSLQSQLEMDRVQGQIGTRSEKSNTSMADGAKLRAAWEKIQRATELLEAERAGFRDERMAMQVLEDTLRRREEALQCREAALAAQVVGMPALKADGPQGVPTTKGFSRHPFNLWSRG